MAHSRGNAEDHALEEIGLESEVVFRGKLLDVRRDVVKLPDGGEATREYVRHPGATVIVAILPDGALLFERQYRYPLHRVFLELPAGKIDAGEEVLACAQRELREETGYEAQDWVHLGTIHPCIGYSDERIEAFLARKLLHVGASLDDGEFLQVVSLAPDAALSAVRAGEITDGKSISALFLALPYLAA